MSRVRLAHGVDTSRFEANGGLSAASIWNEYTDFAKQFTWSNVNFQLLEVNPPLLDVKQFLCDILFLKQHMANALD